MPIFLDPRGKTTYGIAICGRCSRKRFIDDLGIDPNIGPGILFCRDEGPGTNGSCIDRFDPWRLPARPPDQIALRYVRPDDPLTPGVQTTADFITVENGLGYIVLQDGTPPIRFQLEGTSSSLFPDP